MRPEQFFGICKSHLIDGTEIIGSACQIGEQYYLQSIVNLSSPVFGNSSGFSQTFYRVNLNECAKYIGTFYDVLQLFDFDAFLTSDRIPIYITFNSQTLSIRYFPLDDSIELPSGINLTECAYVGNLITNPVLREQLLEMTDYHCEI